MEDGDNRQLIQIEVEPIEYNEWGTWDKSFVNVLIGAIKRESRMGGKRLEKELSHPLKGSFRHPGGREGQRQMQNGPQAPPRRVARG